MTAILYIILSVACAAWALGQIYNMVLIAQEVLERSRGE